MIHVLVTWILDTEAKVDGCILLTEDWVDYPPP